MRAGACTIQQALTAEAASILKHSLNLARRRGHAQVTPLHVAATLLNSSSSASSLLRRACIRSHPHHPTSLPLQCRALELCFNVALNRLPTSPPPSSSSSLLHSHPSLSNALIAALKRAQAHQRRGCIESQNHHSHQTQQQSNQPLLAIKVELEQLTISILDDPSVSRVMREAGFSSTSVKQNLEEDSTKPQPFLFDNSAVFLPTQFMKSVEKKEEDVRVVFDVMIRRKPVQFQQQNGKRSGNAVVVGDSASIAEAIMDELLMRLERGEVPEELRGAQVIKLQLSYVHLRLMSRVDVEMKISDLRRRIFSSLEKGVIVYAGDLRWAESEEDRDGECLGGFRPVEYLISEVGRLLSEFKNGVNGLGGERGKIWVLAFSSYKSYMRCKLINPSLESQWDLQAVLVPSGGLALSLHAPCGMDSVVSKLRQYHFQLLEPRVSNAEEEEEEKLLCCAECFANYEKEAASVLKFEAKEGIAENTQFSCSIQGQKPEKLYKINFVELRRKWRRLCQNLHQSRISHTPSISKVFPSSHPWWSNSLPSTKSKLAIEQSSMSFTAYSKESSKQWPLELNPKPARRPIMTTLALCNPLFTDSATSTDHKKASAVSPRGLAQKLKENIPWQSEHIHLVVDALLDLQLSEKKGTWIMIHGNDRIARRRLVRVVAESLFGSSDRMFHINMKRSASGAIDLLKAALGKESKTVVLIENIDCANPNFVKLINEGTKVGFLKDSCGREVDLANLIFILTSSASTKSGILEEEEEEEEEDCDRVLRLRMCIDGEEEHQPLPNEKRKSEWKLKREQKKQRTADRGELDLNVAIAGDGDGDDDGALSDLTNEVCAGGDQVQLPATSEFNFDMNTDILDGIVEGFTTRLQRAFEAAGNAGGEERLLVDPAVAQELAKASGFFLEVEFDRWVREVFQNCIPTVKRGGKVRLLMEGKEGNRLEFGFQGSALPMKISVD